MYGVLLKFSYPTSGHLPQQPVANYHCSSTDFLQKEYATFSAIYILWSNLTTNGRI